MKALFENDLRTFPTVWVLENSEDMGLQTKVGEKDMQVQNPWQGTQNDLQVHCIGWNREWGD